MISSHDILKFARLSYSRFDPADGKAASVNKEVEYRVCARTAYYALYHYSKSLADALPGEYEDVPSHERVIRKLMKSGDEELVSLAQKMISTRKTRVRADYYTDKSFGKTESYKILRVVEKVFSGVIAEGEVKSEEDSTALDS